jgi:formate hydrogenlyase subunit 6/NADH:ubiquinone oxidoreductase subunit I
MKYRLAYDQKQCSGCLRCQLACSRTYVKQFQPSLSRIQIDAQGEKYRAVFTEDCVKCGFCADNCLFGALVKFPEKEAA